MGFIGIDIGHLYPLISFHELDILGVGNDNLIFKLVKNAMEFLINYGLQGSTTAMSSLKRTQLNV